MKGSLYTLETSTLLPEAMKRTKIRVKVNEGYKLSGVLPEWISLCNSILDIILGRDCLLVIAHISGVRPVVNFAEQRSFNSFTIFTFPALLMCYLVVAKHKISKLKIIR